MPPIKNPNQAFQENVQAPVAHAPITPAPTIPTPAAPVADVNANAALQVPQAPATTVNVNTAPTQPKPAAQPALAMSSNGSVVDMLNMAGQDSSYAARQQLAQQYGIQNYTGTAAQNQDLSKKYVDAHNALKGTAVPENPAEARNALATLQETGKQKQQADPQATFFDAYASMNPVVKTLYDQLNTILSSTGTKQTFKEEFDKLRTDQGIEGLSTDLMNIKNIMDGTDDDIRAEITNAGGFATDSQVQALTGARNKTLLKQAQTLSGQLQIRNDYIDQVMKLSGADRDQVEKDIDRKLGIAEKVADISMKMDDAAKSNYKNIIDSVGFTGLAAAFGNDPKAISAVEKTMGLPLGTLKNEAFLEASIKQGDKPLQFISGTENQAGGVFDPNTGAFIPRGGGGNGSPGASTPSFPVGTSPETANAINTALQVILGSGSFTKQQQANVTNAIARGEDPFTVIKNQAKNIMGQTLATNLSNNEKARSAMTSLQNSLKAYYAAGGKTDIFRGNYENVVAKVGEVKNPELRSLATEIESALQIYRNAVSGTAYSVQEGKAISTIFPGIDKTEGLNDAILKGRMKAFESVIDEGYGQVLGQNTYQQLKQAEQKSSGGTQDSKFDYLTDFITSDERKKKAYLPRSEWSKVEDKDGLLAYIKGLGFDLLINE